MNSSQNTRALGTQGGRPAVALAVYRGSYPAPPPAGVAPATVLFGLLVCVIGLVSAYDVYLSIKHQSVLLQTEENPVGRWLIEADGGDVALFMTAKMVGNVLVLLALPYLRGRRPAWGWIAASAVAAFQVCLFAYLSFA